MNLLGGSLEMLRNLNKGFGGSLGTGLLEERTGGKSLLNDLLRSLDNVLSLIVLLLFLGPFFVSVDLGGIKFGDLGFEESLELFLVLQESDLLVPDGDLLFEFSLKFL